MDDATQKLVDNAFGQVHGQDARRRYSVAEVKQIVYPLIEALRAQRPPVSPEVLAGEVGYPMSPDDVDEAESDEYAEGRASGYNDAFDNVMTALARFSLPVLDVEALPVVAHKGPHDTDESMFLTAADNLDRGYPLGGGNLTRAVVELIRREVARARRAPVSGTPPPWSLLSRTES